MPVSRRTVLVTSSGLRGQANSPTTSSSPRAATRLLASLAVALLLILLANTMTSMRVEPLDKRGRLDAVASSWAPLHVAVASATPRRLCVVSPTTECPLTARFLVKALILRSNATLFSMALAAGQLNPDEQSLLNALPMAFVDAFRPLLTANGTGTVNGSALAVVTTALYADMSKATVGATIRALACDAVIGPGIASLSSTLLLPFSLADALSFGIRSAPIFDYSTVAKSLASRTEHPYYLSLLETDVSAVVEKFLTFYQWRTVALVECLSGAGINLPLDMGFTISDRLVLRDGDLASQYYLEQIRAFLLGSVADSPARPVVLHVPFSDTIWADAVLDLAEQHSPLRDKIFIFVMPFGGCEALNRTVGVFCLQPAVNTTTLGSYIDTWTSLADNTTNVLRAGPTALAAEVVNATAAVGAAEQFLADGGFPTYVEADAPVLPRTFHTPDRRRRLAFCLDGVVAALQYMAYRQANASATSVTDAVGAMASRNAGRSAGLATLAATVAFSPTTGARALRWSAFASHSDLPTAGAGTAHTKTDPNIHWGAILQRSEASGAAWEPQAKSVRTTLFTAGLLTTNPGDVAPPRRHRREPSFPLFYLGLAVVALTLLLYALLVVWHRTRHHRDAGYESTAHVDVDDSPEQMFIFINIPFHRDLSLAFPGDAQKLIAAVMAQIAAALERHPTLTAVKFIENKSVLVTTYDPTEAISFAVMLHNALWSMQWDAVMSNGTTRLAAFYARACGETEGGATEDDSYTGSEEWTADGDSSSLPNFVTMVPGGGGNGNNNSGGQDPQRQRQNSDSAGLSRLSTTSVMWRGVQVRVGMCFGSFERIAGPSGTPDYFGEAVNVATTLMRSAAPGRILFVYAREVPLDKNRIVEFAEINFLGPYKLAGSPHEHDVFDIIPRCQVERIL